MKKIKWLKPTKAEKKLIDDERAAIYLTRPSDRDVEAFNKMIDEKIIPRFEEAFFQDLMKKCEVESGANWIHESVEIDFRNLPKPNLSSTPMRVIVV